MHKEVMVGVRIWLRLVSKQKCVEQFPSRISILVELYFKNIYHREMKY